MLYNMGEVCYNQIGTYGFEAKREKERFTIEPLMSFSPRFNSLKDGGPLNRRIPVKMNRCLFEIKA